VKEQTTYGQTPERLARLLAIGVRDSNCKGNPGAGRTPAQVLRDMLSSDLPLDPAMPDSLPAVLNWPSDKVLAAASQTMNDLLLGSRTDLAVIKTLKDYSKELVRRGESEAKQAAATAIYYAAIASALVFHQHKITQHSSKRLDEAYTELERKPWIPSELKDLFKRARAVSGQPKQEPG